MAFLSVGLRRGEFRCFAVGTPTSKGKILRDLPGLTKLLTMKQWWEVRGMPSVVWIPDVTTDLGQGDSSSLGDDAADVWRRLTQSERVCTNNGWTLEKEIHTLEP